MLYRSGSGIVHRSLRKEKSPPYLDEKQFKKQRKKRRHGKKQKTVTPQPINWRYADYIVSEAWEERKATFYKKFGKRCAACASWRKITLHHTSYRHLGNERDDELVALCWPCHEAVHDEHGVHLDLKDQTAQFVTDRKGELTRNQAFYDNKITTRV